MFQILGGHPGGCRGAVFVLYSLVPQRQADQVLQRQVDQRKPQCLGFHRNDKGPDHYHAGDTEFDIAKLECRGIGVILDDLLAQPLQGEFAQPRNVVEKGLARILFSQAGNVHQVPAVAGEVCR
ncbi:hypothetical protein D3C73_700220 [compost metagenome]